MPDSLPSSLHATLPAGPRPIVAASLSGRRWFMAEAEPRLAAAHAQRLGVPELVGRLLAARGVPLAGAGAFLDPTLRALLPDPCVLADMPRAAARLADAVDRGETVAVFGDYDVDGACGGALLAVLLRGLGVRVINYVPDRLREGYGPNAPAIAMLAAQASLIVCVDCGTAAGEALAAAQGSAEVVVLDHHKADRLPHTTLAVVNPNRADDRSGLGLLCATAVAFLAAIATVRELRRRGAFAHRAEPDLMGLLDLVALATVCDMMPLVGLNRALVVQGLKVMARGDRPGLAALLRVAGVLERPSAMTCGYALGPRINAGGRISRADLGLALLLCDDPIEAGGIAEALDGINRQRQGVEAVILDAAMQAAEAQVAAGHATLLIAAEHWHPGVVGIVAGRVKERFNRPACVAAVADGVAKGSGRSVPGFDLGAAVAGAREAGLLINGGGHAMACGFALAADGLGRLHDFLDAALAGAGALPQAPDLHLDGSVAVGGVTVELAEQIGRLAPYGQGNPEPVLLIPRARVVHAERIGRDGATVRVQLASDSGEKVKAMAFRAADTKLGAALLARDGVPLHLAAQIKAETWNGRTSACAIVQDAIFSD